MHGCKHATNCRLACLLQHIAFSSAKISPGMPSGSHPQQQPLRHLHSIRVNTCSSSPCTETHQWPPRQGSDSSRPSSWGRRPWTRRCWPWRWGTCLAGWARHCKCPSAPSPPEKTGYSLSLRASIEVPHFDLSSSFLLCYFDWSNWMLRLCTNPIYPTTCWGNTQALFSGNPDYQGIQRPRPSDQSNLLIEIPFSQVTLDPSIHRLFKWHQLTSLYSILMDSFTLVRFLSLILALAKPLFGYFSHLYSDPSQTKNFQHLLTFSLYSFASCCFFSLPSVFCSMEEITCKKWIWTPRLQFMSRKSRRL